jgi:hypothetical protein
LQELLSHNGKAQPAPIFEWGEADEGTEMFAQRALGNLGGTGEVGHAKLAVHIPPHVVDGFFDIARRWPAFRAQNTIEAWRRRHAR